MLQDAGSRPELLHVVEFCRSMVGVPCPQPGEHTHVLSSQSCCSPVYATDPGAAYVSTAARGHFCSWSWCHTINLSVWLYNLVLHSAVE